MTKVFLSYRRDDTNYIAGRIGKRLADRFGKSHVFMDIDTIRPGMDFRHAIHEAVSQCDAFLAIMGPGWTDARDEAGNRRLDDEQDFVRIEIEGALQREIPVIPVLVNKAVMPSSSELPQSIREFAFRQAALVRADPDFDRDMGDLEEVLAGVSPSPPITQPTSGHRGNRSEPREWPMEFHGDVAYVCLPRYLGTQYEMQEHADQVVAKIQARDCLKVVISLDQHRLLNSSMFVPLFRIFSHLRKVGGRLRLCDLSTTVREIIRIQHLDQVFELVDDRDAAINHWD